VSYKYSLPILGGALVAYGLIERGWWLVVSWLGVNFMILGVAHAKGWHRILGKRPNGALAWWSWVIYLPLLTYTLGVWHLMRWLSREPRINVVTNDLVVGRRLLSSELEGEFANYVDLTGEFAEPSGVRCSPSYRNFPILDGSAPHPDTLRAAVASLKRGRTFIHCAQGHGRTGLFALAVLLHQGSVKSVEEGLQRLRAVRPGILLNRDQRECIQTYAADMT
jgi:hypothetical protein